MGQIMAYEENKEPDAELATRMGELAMLIYSIGSSLNQWKIHSNISLQLVLRLEQFCLTWLIVIVASWATKPMLTKMLSYRV